MDRNGNTAFESRLTVEDVALVRFIPDKNIIGLEWIVESVAKWKGIVSNKTDASGIPSGASEPLGVTFPVTFGFGLPPVDAK